jgi:hypothetical protein
VQDALQDRLQVGAKVQSHAGKDIRSRGEGIIQLPRRRGRTLPAVSAPRVRGDCVPLRRDCAHRIRD